MLHAITISPIWRKQYGSQIAFSSQDDLKLIIFCREDATSAMCLHGSRAYPFTDVHFFLRLQKWKHELAEKASKDISYIHHVEPIPLTQRLQFFFDGCLNDVFISERLDVHWFSQEFLQLLQAKYSHRLSMDDNNHFLKSWFSNYQCLEERIIWRRDDLQYNQLFNNH